MLSITQVRVQTTSEESGHTMEWTMPYAEGMECWNKLVMDDGSSCRHAGTFDDLSTRTAKPLMVELRDSTWWFHPIYA